MVMDGILQLRMTLSLTLKTNFSSIGMMLTPKRLGCSLEQNDST